MIDERDIPVGDLIVILLLLCQQMQNIPRTQFYTEDGGIL